MPVQAVVPLAEVEVVGGIVALAEIAQSHGREHPGGRAQFAEAVGPVLAAAIADRGLAVHRPGCCRAAEDPDAEEAVHAARGGPLLVVVDVGVADFARGPLLVDVIVVGVVAVAVAVTIACSLSIPSLLPAHYHTSYACSHHNCVLIQ